MNYKEYQDYLGEIPHFMEKYLDLDILKRLKNISLLCGMEYASRDMYDFKLYISRYDHSLNVALITWNLTHDKKATLAALFHDVSSPTFSHVVDYMNGDYINQESTEEMTEEVLKSSPKLIEFLNEDGLDLDDISNFKIYSVVDLPRPYMCADRLENIISVGMSWVGELTLEDAKRILDSIYLTLNEENVPEIAFLDEDVSLYVKYINDIINKLTHTKEDNYMMNLLANILKLSIVLGLFSYKDLFVLTEDEIVDILENYSNVDDSLDEMWLEFKTVKEVKNVSYIEIKNKVLNPLVRGRRLNK